MELINFILHVDTHLAQFAASNGALIYGLLFLIVFVETGVVVMPLLPGDSLLFAAGALAAKGIMDPALLAGLLWAAAVLGDNCNYAIGKRIGHQVYQWNSRWIRRDYLERTHAFFEQHGGKAIVIARFMPFLRTFVPFVAGVGGMEYRRFLACNVLGGALWVGAFINLGYFFGNLPAVKENFTLALLGIILISLLPGLVAALPARRKPEC